MPRQATFIVLILHSGLLKETIVALLKMQLACLGVLGEDAGTRVFLLAFSHRSVAPQVLYYRRWLLQGVLNAI